MNEPQSGAWQIEDLLAQLRRLGERRGRIVFTNGCFDLIHAGHVESLRQASALGDRLVVGLNSDASVRALKGPGRPILPLSERATLLAAIRWVDHVVPFDEPTPVDLIRRLRPDVYVKGSDWEGQPLPEADLIREQGGEVIFLARSPGCSTTEIIERIRALPLRRPPRN